MKLRQRQPRGGQLTSASPPWLQSDWRGGPHGVGGSLAFQAYSTRDGGSKRVDTRRGGQRMMVLPHYN